MVFCLVSSVNRLRKSPEKRFWMLLRRKYVISVIIGIKCA